MNSDGYVQSGDPAILKSFAHVVAGVGEKRPRERNAEAVVTYDEIKRRKIDEMSVGELRAELKKRGLGITGVSETLRQRLLPAF